MGTLANSEDPDEMQFIRVCTVCKEKSYLQRKKYNIFLNYKLTLQYIQWTILTSLYVALWKIPVVWKGLASML